jgi:acetyl-CoA acetyltransferase
VIVGIAESPPQTPPGTTPLQLQARCAKAALEEAGLALRDVDAVLSTALGWSATPSMHLAEYLGTTPRFVDSTNVGGSSFEAHVGHAALAIAAGVCEVALIAFGSTQRSAPEGPPEHALPARYTEQFERVWGLPWPVGAYAMAARRHMHEYGTTSEQLADVAVATRAWARLNPAARRREPLTVDDVLASPLIAEPLHLLDCCLVTDGGGAIVMTSAGVARSCSTRPVAVLGQGEATTHATIASMPDLTRTAAVESGRDAFARAGIGHADVDVAEIYDSFTITVLLNLEGLGFCAPGEGGEFVAGGRTAPGGAFPLNTNGGGLSCRHPGMYGIFLLIEAVRQLRGDAGERQVETAQGGIALAHGTGGHLSSAATVLLGAA